MRKIAITILLLGLAGCVGKTGPTGPKGNDGVSPPWPITYARSGRVPADQPMYWVSVPEVQSAKHSTQTYMSVPGADSLWLVAPMIWSNATGDSAYISTWAEGASGVYLFNWYVDLSDRSRRWMNYKIVVTVGS